MAATEPQRKKIRPIRSCLPCRSRRIKCDQLNPVCTNCMKAGRSCQYTHSSAASTATATEASAPQGLNTSTSVTSSSQRLTPNNVHSEPDMGLMHRSLGGKTEYYGPSFWGISGKNGPELDQFLEHQMLASPNPLSLYEGSSRMHYHTGDDVSVFALFQQEALVHDRLHTLGHIINKLPAKEVCDELWRTFIATIYPLIPILHLPTMYRQLDQFWISVQQYHADGIPGGFLAECPSFLALVVSTLFCGTFHRYDAQLKLYMPSTSKTNREERLARRLYRSVMHSLALLSFPGDATIFSLAAYLIWNIPLIREESERSTAFTCTAFRVGQKLGLHRDPERFQMAYWEAETRRRIWWHIIHKDTLSSTASGLPQMLWNQKQHDTVMVCESRDTDHGGSNRLAQLSAILPARGLDEVTPTQSFRVNEDLGCKDFKSLNDETADCRQVVSVGRFLVTSAIRQILGRQVGGYRWTANDVQAFQVMIEQMSLQVRGRISRLIDSELDSSSDPTAVEGITPEQIPSLDRQSTIDEWGLQSTSQNRVFISWSRKLLALMIEKANCVLYQPLQSYFDKTLWKQFRETAISHFHAYIEQYVDLATEPSYAPFHWMYPGNYQPLQAVTALLGDMLENPSSPETRQSRFLIDSVFSLNQREHGVVAEDGGHLQPRHLTDGDKRAWTMLRRFRHRVWKQMGIDPTVMWTCARRHDHGEDPSSIDEDSSDEDVDAMPGISAQRSSAEENQYDLPPAQSIEDSLGVASDDNFTFDDAFQNYWQDSFLAFGEDQENVE